MTTAQLKSPGGNVVAEFQLPRSLADVPLNRYVDFLIETSNIRRDDNAIAAIVRAVNSFYNIRVDELAAAAVGDFGINSPVFDGTLRSLYGWAVNLIEKFTPSLPTAENGTFQFGGKTFVMPTIIQSAARGEQMLPNLNVIEAIEAAEVQRRIGQAIDDNRAARRKLMKETGVNVDEMEMIVAAAERDKAAGNFVSTPQYLDALEIVNQIHNAGDPSGSFIYSQFLQMLAILYREPDEHLPTNDGQRELFINNRAAFFAGIDAATALNCSFFLKSILKGFEGFAAAVIFLNLRTLEVLVLTRLLKKKRKTGRNATMKRFSNVSVGGK